MQNRKNRLIELSNEYDVHIRFENDGCIVFYNNTQDTDVIPYSSDITMDYILNNFEMVADLSKLQLNIHQIQY